MAGHLCEQRGQLASLFIEHGALGAPQTPSLRHGSRAQPEEDGVTQILEQSLRAPGIRPRHLGQRELVAVPDGIASDDGADDATGLYLARTDGLECSAGPALAAALRMHARALVLLLAYPELVPDLAWPPVQCQVQPYLRRATVSQSIKGSKPLIRGSQQSVRGCFLEPLHRLDDRALA